MSEPKNYNAKYRVTALFLAFLPSAMLLGCFAIPHNIQKGILMAACNLSIACCFLSSFMMFARRTGLAILAGVLFLILNGLIAFFFGCAVAASNIQG
jgi:hypothetical protein